MRRTEFVPMAADSLPVSSYIPLFTASRMVRSAGSQSTPPI
ncbi:hypothetical protein [[Clostridium] aminophilum]|nr:hypothetical protein [[Clostridium] aminophilum]